MNAKEARELSEKVSEKLAIEYIATILIKIKNASSNGQSSTTFKIGSLSYYGIAIILAKLRELGYVVSTINLPEMDITW